jgi:DNA-binding transcriptional MocR family regulator
MGHDYRRIADALAADIAEGRLKPGERLPPQRQFAWSRGIAVSTASRAYAELVRRGLVTGEVGRGTYVRAAPAPVSPALTEPARAPIDLELNFPLPPGLGEALAPALRRLCEPAALAGALRPVTGDASASARAVAAALLARGGWRPDPDGLLFTGSGRQAIAAALCALGRPGDRIGVEALTYAAVKGIAARLGLTLSPIAMDEQGLLPDSLFEAHAKAPLQGVYLQPSLHNPTGASMGPARRAELAAALRATDLLAIEDAVYGFLADEAPLAAFAPERVVLIDSLSKRVAPGLTLGFVAAPASLADRVAAAVRAGGWAAQGFALAAGLGWIAEGIVDQLGEVKRADARARQALAQEKLAGLQIRADPRAYHLWLELPSAWRAEAFVGAVARRGIALTPAAAFAVVTAHAPNAVRLALASTPTEILGGALSTLQRLALSGPEDFSID